MWRQGSIRILRLGSIAVDIHLSFALVIAWGAWQGWVRFGNIAGAGFGILTVILLFVSVLLHELGHGVQARAFGFTVRRITLLPIGGLAELETTPSYHSHELLIALAGPIVNLGLAIATGSIAYLIQPFAPASWADYLLLTVPPSATSALLYTFWVNVVLFVFNMIPAFPMDGGRVLRSALAMLTNYEAGTRLAAWSGRLIAIGLAVLGARGLLFEEAMPNPILVVLALVVWVGAQQEETYVRRRRTLVQVEVEDVYRVSEYAVEPWETVTRRMLKRAEKAGGILPVITGDRIIGLLNVEVAQRALRQRKTVAHVMQTHFPAVEPRETLWVALQEMSTYQLAALPVMRGHTFCGIISLDDIRHIW